MNYPILVLGEAAARVAEVLPEVEVWCSECGWSMMVSSKELPVFCRGIDEPHARLACYIIPQEV